MKPDQRLWCANAAHYGGSFISGFAKTCIYADEENFKILEPVLNILMQKYPKYLENYETHT